MPLKLTKICAVVKQIRAGYIRRLYRFFLQSNLSSLPKTQEAFEIDNFNLTFGNERGLFRN